MSELDIKALVKEVNDKVFDETFVKKYGTSVSSNMGLEYENSLVQNFNQLKEEFHKIDKDHNSYIDKNELFDFLNKLNTEQGRNIKLQKHTVTDLFSFLDIDADNKITIKEFIMSYLIIQEKIKLKQWKIKNLIEDIDQLKEKYIEKLSQAKSTEVRNELGVSTEAKLNVTVVGLTKLEENNFMNNLISIEPYVKLILGSDERKTSFTNGNYNSNNSNSNNNSSKFSWNEDFEFSISNLNQYISIELYDKNSLLNNALGKIELNLKDYSHQNKVQESFTLKKDDKDIGFTIVLKLSLIWSHVKLYESFISKLETRETKFNEEYLELSKFESLIKQPFGLLLTGEYDYLINHLDVEPEIGAIGRKTIVGKNPLMQSRASKNDFFKQSFTNNSINKYNNTQSNRELLPYDTQRIRYLNFPKNVFNLIIAILCLNLFSSLQGKDYLGPLIYLLLIIIHYLSFNKEAVEYLTKLRYLMTINIVFDKIWLVIYFKGFLIKSDDYDFMFSPLQRIVYVVSFVNLIMKIILLIVLFKKPLTEQNSSNNTVNNNISIKS